MIPDSYLDDLQAALATRAEDICRIILPGGKKVGRVWKCGGVDGGPGKSLEVELVGDKAGVWTDHATGEAGRLLKLIELNRGCKFKDAVEAAAEMVSMGPPDKREHGIDPRNFIFSEPPSQAAPQDDGPPAYKPASSTIDWDRCVEAFTPEKAAELCEWRGLSPEFVTHLRNERLIGCWNGNFCFPVTGSNGKIHAVHYKTADGWRYYPQGAQSSIFIIGSPNHATYTLAFESQWDAFSVLDKLHAHHPDNQGIYAALITRSATSNTDVSAYAAPHLIACPQNDPAEKNGKPNVNKEGRTPSQEWLHRIQSSRNRISQFSVFENPAKHKDANDWIRAERPDHYDVFNKIIEQSKNPILKSAKSAKDILSASAELREKGHGDPNSLIGFERRFLSKGGSWMIIGPSGVGKSTLTSGLCMHAAGGVAWHGLTFRRPLKTLVVQAENDEGDLAEMLEGTMRVVLKEFSPTQQKNAVNNLIFEQVTDKIGDKFCRWLEEIIREGDIDLVVIDPLLSFVGDDISQQKVASQFFRNYLQPVLKRTGAICIIVHHTGKPPKEKDSQKNWNDSDFSYIGLGSSEIVNWPRAVSVLVHTQEKGTFLFKNCKRGGRAGMRNQFTGEIVTDIYLRHGRNLAEGSQWLQTQKPEEDEVEAPKKGGKTAKPKMSNQDALSHLGAVCTYKDIYDVMVQIGGMSGTAAKGAITDLLMARALVRGEDGFYRRPEPNLV